MPATIVRFTPPANLNDFDSIPNQTEAWHETISYFFDGNIRRIQEELRTSKGTPQFYNPAVTETASDMQTIDITWNAFPRIVEVENHNNPDRYFPAAEELAGGIIRVQDEYCEWHTERDRDGKVTRVTFTCEGPEYWEALADGYPKTYNGQKSAGAKGSKELLLTLYRKYISPDVQLKDLLLPDGTYNPLNRWNTTDGAMHLINPSNTLGAEINIAARATVLRKDANGQLIQDAIELIDCSNFGARERFSDPTIGFQVNKLAQQGSMITLLDPVGLYISDLDTGGFDARGKDPKEFWKILRGEKGRILRAVYEVPESEGFKVGDITIGGLPIEYGGQIAQNITMKLTGVACKHHSVQNEPISCPVASNRELIPSGLAATNVESLPSRDIR
ncbi:hypothetical protein ACFFSY_17440 [Paenibacillus aurantiacus]|uniref:Uncharacterized protein n=1 Tax=Paenibacillus aurantiacus TaxID=1936118 RepID=A0ABV5KR55_9BACL